MRLCVSKVALNVVRAIYQSEIMDKHLRLVASFFKMLGTVM